MKTGLLTGMIAIMTLGGISTSVNVKSEAKVSGPNDTRIIVEVDKSIEGLSKKEIYASQDKLLNSIKRNVSSNCELGRRYSVLNNAFVLDVNSADVEKIRELDGVASVTINTIHAKKDLGEGKTYSARFTLPQPVSGEDTNPTMEVEENISATTMNKPSDTNDGEGTVIAILDNEFYLRGVHEANAAEKDSGAAWNHAVFKPLESNVATRFTFESVGELLENGDFNASRKKGKAAGEEGSLYFNNKVPFYFDYGGESTSYGKAGNMDYDVSSRTSYHGSHVASIAAANADVYKGIAPKAQLACMKVFTNYEADETGKKMGFSDSSGAYDECILAAVEDAISLGVDGINMSLGSDLDDFDGDSLTMKTLRSLASDSHILSAISAGNAGKASYSFTGGYGNWTTDMVETGILGSYANNTDNMIIASGQPTKIFYENAFKLRGANGEELKNVSYEDQIVNREGLEADYDEDKQHWMVDLVKDPITGEVDQTKVVDWIYVPGFGQTTDYDTATDYTGKVVVVNRGSTSFADKYAVAVSKRASGIVIINNDPTANDFNFRCSFGEGFAPSIPCALALFKDKPTFEANKSGTFTFLKKAISNNDLAKTFSTYSSDGARFDYTLKPDITTPGENIRGAVPPQKAEHREETPYSTYEYLSGTSMAAPNYAGVQSVMTSKVAKDVYKKTTVTAADVKKVEDFRKTVDLRLMSTANPMFEPTVNSETGTLEYTSPRIQGAGLVDLNKAYHTDIYLDGLDAEGNRINKSKIQLQNNDDIARGTVKLSFAAVNETGAPQAYTAKVKVMRPAIASNNKVLSKEYKDMGELDSLEKLPGLTYVSNNYSSSRGQYTEIVENSSTGYPKNSVVKLTKQLIYFTELQYDASGKVIKTVEEYDQSKGIVLEPGNYYNSASRGCIWEPLPNNDYQSIQDVTIAEFTQDIVIQNGESRIDLDAYNLSEEVKTDILNKFPYGCAIEGYVELIQNDERKLSMPYLGFYSGTDRDSEQTLASAPVVEPFAFEKDNSKIYASDLVNDVTKQLVGKDSVEFGSTWVTGYSSSVLNIDKDPLLSNDSSLKQLKGYHEVGYNPATEAYFENAKDNIYVGNPEKSNTMIIQQFVMRSVADNYFEIKDEKGNVVYKSVLEDMLFGGSKLYKSHVDANYLSAGYVAHRAWAIIPLYDINTHKPFESGNYTITFNYQLQCDKSWTSNSYNFVIDSSSPEISAIKEYKGADGEDRIRIEVKDQMICGASLGDYMADVYYDDAKKVYYLDETKEYIKETMADLYQPENGQERLVVTLTDAAYGETTAIIHFFGKTFENYVIAQGSELTVKNDFIKDGEEIKFITIDYSGNETEYKPTGYISVKTSFGEEFVIEPITVESGCGGSILAASGIISLITLAGCGLLLAKKRKEKESK